MIDYFALLQLPRRPWLDPEVLKERFHSLSGAAHPDRFHQAEAAVQEQTSRHYLELNTAWQCLREPKDRLAHLIELETGARPKQVQDIPPGVMELFVAIGPVLRGTDQLLAEQGRATSPLLRVQLMERGLEWTERCQALQQTLQARRAEVDEELKRLNRAWEAREGQADAVRQGELPLHELERKQQTLSYLTRWAGQLQERIVQLAG